MRNFAGMVYMTISGARFPIEKVVEWSESVVTY